MEGSGTLEKIPEFSGTFFFMPKEARLWNNTKEFRNLWNTQEYMVLIFI